MKKLTNIQIENVLAYVRGKMKPEEKLDFEKKISSNPLLKEEVDFQSSIISALNLDGVEDHMDQARIENLIEHKKSHPQYKAIQKNLELARTANTSKKNQFKKILVFSIAILFIGAICVVGINNSQEDRIDISLSEITNSLDFDTDLMREYYEVSAKSEDVKKTLKVAKVDYENQEWDKVLLSLKEIEGQADLKSIALQFYYSIILFKQNEFQKSIEILENLDFKKNAGTCKIQYFLILSYLNVDEKSKAEAQYFQLKKHLNLCDKETIKELKNYF